MNPPPVSRIDRAPPRGYRVLTRTSDRHRTRERFVRQRKQRPMAELLGLVLRDHRLTDEIRQRVVCLHWPELAGERIAAKIVPASLADGVLHVSAISSVWVQEMQYCKTKLIADINRWAEANRIWLGPAPLVTDVRCALGSQRREPLVDPAYARALRERHIRRTRPVPRATPPVISDAERDAIRSETGAVADDDLRKLIESVRLKWNR